MSDSAYYAFQSLFWWNVVTYGNPPKGKMRCDHVSILVLVECSYLRGHHPGRGKQRCVSILVLVECSYLPFGRAPARRSRPSFNPCSGGM